MKRAKWMPLHEPHRNLAGATPHDANAAPWPADGLKFELIRKAKHTRDDQQRAGLRKVFHDASHLVAIGEYHERADVSQPPLRAPLVLAPQRWFVI
jgi:hypothetical protein